MEFGDQAAESFAVEVETYLREEVGEQRLAAARATGDGHDPGIHRELASRGWVAGPWPTEFGGGGWDPYRSMALRLGLRRAGYPSILLATSTFVGHVIQQIGTDFQKSTVLPALVSGEAVICLGYTEPDSGSDVMAARTRAVRDGEEWVIDGTKMFTTGAHLARWCFLLARTDPQAPKHAGLTMFLVPMNSPGITINPVHTISDERSNAVFYDATRIDDRWRVGEVDGGVRVLAIALEVEQGTTFLTEMEELLDAALAWAQPAAGGPSAAGDPVVREAIAELALDVELARLLVQQVLWRRVEGVPDEGRGPMSKLFSSERLAHHAGVLLDLMGADGVCHGEPERLYRFAPGTTIYGGTSEILRSRIAESGLGLARSRK